MEENPHQSPAGVDEKPSAPARTPNSDDALNGALKFGVYTQLVVLFFTVFVDPPTVGFAYVYTMIGYYLGVASIMARRRASPTPADLLFLKWSPLAFLVVAVCGTMLVHEIRGY